MKFGVTYRYTGDVLFVADINCSDDAPLATKRGLAVKWALRNGAPLQCTDLRGADLKSVNFRGVDLRRSDLRDANLRFADMESVDLRRATLEEADLWCANMEGGNLQGVNMRGANLRAANLQGVDFQNSDLRRVDLRGACMQDIGLRGVKLGYAVLDYDDTPFMTLLRLWKLRHSWTDQEVALHLRVSRGSVRNWLSGRKRCRVEGALRIVMQHIDAQLAASDPARVA